VRVVCYETLCSTPLRTSETLFAFAGLAPGGQTRRFLSRSAHAHGRDAYFSVFKNAVGAAGRWEEDLSATEQAAIRSVVERTRSYAAYCALISTGEARAARSGTIARRPPLTPLPNPPQHVVRQQRLGPGGKMDHANQHVGLVRVG
jgi:hypothetical protein